MRKQSLAERHPLIDPTHPTRLFCSNAYILQDYITQIH